MWVLLWCFLHEEEDGRQKEEDTNMMEMGVQQCLNLDTEVEFFLVVGADLCIVGCQVVSLVSTHQGGWSNTVPVLWPSKMSPYLAKCPLGGQTYFKVENHQTTL